MIPMDSKLYNHVTVNALKLLRVITHENNLPYDSLNFAASSSTIAEHCLAFLLQLVCQ